MDIRRYISTRTWGESWFEPLTTTEKLIWIYLLTNPATNMLGIYGLTIRRIGYDCNTSTQVVRRCIKKLEELDLIIMIHGYVIINHWLTQNAMNPSMKVSALKDFDNLPGKVVAALPVTLLTNVQKMRIATGQPVPHPSPHLPCEAPEKEKESGKEQEQSIRKRIINESIPQPLIQAYEQSIGNQLWMEALCMNTHLTPDALREWLEKFCRKLQNEGSDVKSVSDFRRHFANWLPIQLEKQRKHPQSYENPATTNRKESQQRKLDTITALSSIVNDDARKRIEQLKATGILPPLPET